MIDKVREAFEAWMKSEIMKREYTTNEFTLAAYKAGRESMREDVLTNMNQFTGEVAEYARLQVKAIP